MAMRSLLALATIVTLSSAARADSHPALPLPLAELPVDVVFIGDATDLEAPRAPRYACGEPKIEDALMDDDPEQGGRDIAHALVAPEITVASLRCRDELARGGVNPSRVHSVHFEHKGQRRSVYVLAWSVAALPATSTLAHDASDKFAGKVARCFAPLQKPSKPCDELSPTIMKLRDGIWLAGDLQDVSALLATQRGTSPGKPDEKELLAASRDLTAPTISVVASEFWAWGARFGPAQRLPWFRGKRDKELVRAILANDPAHAASIERTLVDALATYRRQLESAATKAAKPCKGCKSAYDRYLHVRPKRELAEAKATVIETDGRIVRVRQPDIEEKTVVAAERARDTERAQRAKKVTALLAAWRQGRAPTPKDLRAIGGEALVRTVKERSK